MPGKIPETSFSIITSIDQKIKAIDPKKGRIALTPWEDVQCWTCKAYVTKLFRSLEKTCNWSVGNKRADIGNKLCYSMCGGELLRWVELYSKISGGVKFADSCAPVRVCQSVNSQVGFNVLLQGFLNF